MNWSERPPLIIHGNQVRVFLGQVADGQLMCFVAREPLGPKGEIRWHLSISHTGKLLNADGVPLPGRIPHWDEIKEARYKFCPNNCYMAMILPPQEEYVDLHPTTMHLHEIEKDA